MKKFFWVATKNIWIVGISVNKKNIRSPNFLEEYLKNNKIWRSVAV